MLQKRVYETHALGIQGKVSRENPISQFNPYFAENTESGKYVECGAFVFKGTNPQRQAKSLGIQGEVPLGIAIYNGLQINTGIIDENGNINNVLVQNGFNIAVLLKGCIFLKPPLNNATFDDNVLVDPLTGKIRTSVNTSISATSGSLNFNVISVVDDWKTTTNGTLTLKIDGINRVVTGLDFSAIVTIADIASILNTAFSSYATCIVNSNGLLFTSLTTGITSSVIYVETTGDIKLLLNATSSNIVEINGENSYINTGWKVIDANTSGQIIEVQKL